MRRLVAVDIAPDGVRCAAADNADLARTIRLRTKTLRGQFEMTVADDGDGIDEATRPQVFDPFFTTKEVGQGTGHGLAIVRSSIVEKHGGSITIQAEKGHGTDFALRLPLHGQPHQGEPFDEEASAVC